jgi:hypothetical protein
VACFVRCAKPLAKIQIFNNVSAEQGENNMNKHREKSVKGKLVLGGLAAVASLMLTHPIYAAEIVVRGTEAQQLTQTLQQIGVQAAQDEHGGTILLTREINCSRQVTQNAQAQCYIHEYTQDIRIQEQSELANQLYQQLQSAGAQYESDTPEETKVGVYMLSCYQGVRPQQAECQGQAHN